MNRKVKRRITRMERCEGSWKSWKIVKKDLSNTGFFRIKKLNRFFYVKKLQNKLTAQLMLSGLCL